MVEIRIVYEGGLHARSEHGPSKSQIQTDAPADNMGRGEAFSPTDLLATSLGTCIITTMGIVAQREGIDLVGTRVLVQKEMTTTGPRRVAKLTVVLDSAFNPDPVQKQKLENAAHACPVKRSLHPDVLVDLTINWNRP